VEEQTVPESAPIAAVRKGPSRIIGLDYGMARIGVAVSDEQKIIATSLTTCKTERKLNATVTKLVDQIKAHAAANRYELAEIVIGLPLMMSGKKGMLADEVVAFVELLKPHFSCPIATWDERLTSVQADKSLREGNFTRKKRAGLVDAVAATIILQNYLDHKSIRNSHTNYE
jgi:putative Holliday junction resolvase